MMNSLPIQLTTFIGREEEVAEIRYLLGKTRLLSLVGAGGCGKTRLALHAAQSLRERFSDGICWIELAAIADPSLLPHEMLTALAPNILREEAGYTGYTPLDLLISHLRDKSILLILDNCEHLVVACAHLATALLRAAPLLHILTTSRERLKIEGEHVWHVPSLSIPHLSIPHPALLARQQQGSAQISNPPLNPITLDEIARYEAVRLFVERAKANRRDFELSEQNALAVAQICWRLDGMPLAIELAAARTSLLSAAQIVTNLDRSLSFLEDNSRSRLPRHLTLRATMDWSFQLLSAREQQLLQRLSVFRGGFTLDAVEVVCIDAPDPSHVLLANETQAKEIQIKQKEALDLLALLVNKSLVAVEEIEGVARYRLLEVIRQYADEKLEQSQEKRLMLHRHLAWALALAEEADANSTGPDRSEQVARLNAEHDNFRAALEWSLSDPHDRTLLEKSARLAIALTAFWSFCGYAEEGQLWIDRVLAHRQLLPATLEAHALVLAGVLKWATNDFEHSAAFLEEGQALARGLGDEVTYPLMLASNYLGFVSYYQDQYARATAYYEEALHLMQRLGLDSYVPFAYSLKARVAVRQGDYARAASLGEKSLLLSYQEGNVHSISATLNLLGTVACYQGNFEKALPLLEESLALSRTLAIQQDIADTLVILAKVALAQGEDDHAQKVLEESLSISREIGYRQGIALSLGHLGELLCRQQAFAEARGLLHESLRLFQHIGAAWNTLYVLEIMALCHLASGEKRQRSPHAAKLLGAVHATRTLLGAPRPPIEQIRYEHTLARAQDELGPPHFEDAWREGMALELSDATLVALSDGHLSVAALTVGQKVTPKLEVISSAHPSLAIYALGPVEIYREGVLVTNAEWEYAKPRALFFYLLCHPPRTREQIGLVLWPEASISQLRSRFHIALHRLRQALGHGEWVTFEKGRYRINERLPCWFDVASFNASLQAILQTMQRLESRLAQRATLSSDFDGEEEAAQKLEQTLRLYRGDFLEEMEPYDWLLQQREALRGRYLNGLLTLGDWRFRAGDFAAAAQSYRRAIATDPYFEVAHRELMRSLARLRAEKQALRHYQEVVALFADELGTTPDAETIALAESLRRRSR